LWNRERQLNLRVGRLYIPFGEEYLVRNAINNPLISHSLSDLWGWDQGVELYGSAGHFNYVLAVLNGGVQDLTDSTSDKTVSARLGYEPVKYLHLSLNAMRTGALDTKGDQLSAIWFANGFFRSLGTNTTRFETELVEGDVRLRWPQGHVTGAGGYIHYHDNNQPSAIQRDVYYYYVEALQNVTRQFYGAVRWSQIIAHKGFPVAGNGNFADYFFNNGNLTTDAWRLSLGLGYRWSQNLLLKTEYTFDHGRTIGGDKRSHEDLFAAEVAFKF